MKKYVRLLGWRHNIQLNDTQHNDPQHKWLVCDTRDNNALPLCKVSHFIHCYAECRYAEYRYAEYRYAECRYAECHNAESICHYAASL